MKKALAAVILVLFLSGCGSDALMQRGMSLRERLLQSQGCSFDAVVTADFGAQTYTFTMACTADQEGNVSFTVTAPDSIRGITGIASATGGSLIFDGMALTFPLLADGEVSPVSGPWLFIKTLRGGYLTSCGMEEDLLRLTIDDSYEADALQLDIWLNERDIPLSAEVLWQGRRVLSLSIENFAFV